MKICICIKDGFMTDGEQFCYRNKEYKYKRCPEPAYLKYSDDYPYIVISEILIGREHTMGESFFFEYFMPFENMLEDKLFEI